MRTLEQSALISALRSRMVCLGIAGLCAIFFIIGLAEKYGLFPWRLVETAIGHQVEEIDFTIMGLIYLISFVMCAALTVALKVFNRK